MNRLAGLMIMTVVFVEPFLVALWIAVGSGRRRRPHFWARFLLASLALPALLPALVGVAVLHVLPLSDDVAKQLLTLMFFLGVLALMFVPGLLYHPSDPGPSDSDGGGGSGPGHPRPSPGGPGGGIPLPDADQARARVRDHHRPKLHDLKRRGRAHEPRRTPMATRIND